MQQRYLYPTATTGTIASMETFRRIRTRAVHSCAIQHDSMVLFRDGLRAHTWLGFAASYNPRRYIGTNQLRLSSGRCA